MTDLTPGSHVTNPSLTVQAGLDWTTLTPVQAEHLLKAIGDIPSLPVAATTQIQGSDLAGLHLLKSVLQKIVIPHGAQEALPTTPHQNDYLASIFSETLSFDLKLPPLKETEKDTLANASHIIAQLEQSPSETVRMTAAKIREVENEILGRSPTILLG